MRSLPIWIETAMERSILGKFIWKINKCFKYILELKHFFFTKIKSELVIGEEQVRKSKEEKEEGK